MSVTLTGGSPSWAAFQDGAGSWSSAGIGGTAKLTVRDSNGRYGFAIGYTEPSGKRGIRIWQGTLTELPAINYAVPVTSPASITVSAPTVTGTLGNEAMDPAFGYATTSVTSTPSSFSLVCAPGTADLTVTLWDTTTGAATRTWIQRNRTFSSNATLPALSMSGATATVPVPVTISGTNPTVDRTVMGGWFTAGGTSALIDYQTAAPANTTAMVVAPAQFTPADVQNLLVHEETSTSERWASNYFQVSSGLHLTLPPAMSGALLSSNGTITGQWSSVPGATRYYGYFDQAYSALHASVYISSGWIGGGPNYSYVAPNFQTIAPGWAFVPGQTISWSYQGTGSSYPYQPYATPVRAYAIGDWDFVSKVYGSLASPSKEGPNSAEQLIRPVTKTTAPRGGMASPRRADPLD